MMFFFADNLPHPPTPSPFYGEGEKGGEVERQNTPFLLVGLGNPGREFKNSRHNLGFMVMDRLAGRLDVKFARAEAKALVGRGEYQGRKLILAKPMTFMNLSGRAVGGLLHYYKIPTSQLLVAYDDIDLPFGRLRLRAEGGSAGQKGMKSIIDQLGTREFPRLRVGVSRPSGRMEAADYVLQGFGREESAELPGLLDRAVELILVFINEGLTAAMNKFNAANGLDEEQSE